jgi:acyl carrier protein
MSISYRMRCGSKKMSNIESRVSACFMSIFPELAEADVARASQASLAQWDSVAHVTLLSAIAEEFQIELDEESFDSLSSYLLIVDFVEGRLGQA